MEWIKLKKDMSNFPKEGGHYLFSVLRTIHHTELKRILESDPDYDYETDRRWVVLQYLCKGDSPLHVKTGGWGKTKLVAYMPCPKPL